MDRQVPFRSETKVRQPPHKTSQTFTLDSVNMLPIVLLLEQKTLLLQKVKNPRSGVLMGMAMPSRIVLMLALVVALA